MTRGNGGTVQALSFGRVLEDLRSAQKPGDGVPAYTRWVNRGMARRVASTSSIVRPGRRTITLV